ncbi:uncharacterized protein LOC141647583 [Silene latifolia]|uniref:uncharacterized protein LOC141647583 n=1 Tax=Silene latifolia TaxID=37657 RepID=UPI003D77356B
MINASTKRIREENNPSNPSFSITTNTNKKNKFAIFSTNYKATVVWVDLLQFTSENNGGGVHNVGPISAALQPGRAYTVGRSNRHAEFIFNDPRVSKQHCQLLYDGFLKKLYLLNGALLISSSVNCAHSDDYGSNCYNNCVVDEFRSRLVVKDRIVEETGRNNSSCFSCRYVYRSALNGVFVNGVDVSEGLAVELGVGDEVLLVCRNRTRVCSDFNSRIGFVVRKIVFHEELIEPGFDGFRLESPRLVRPLFGSQVNKRVFALRVGNSEPLSSECDEVVGRAKSLLAHCSHIAGSYDPVSCIRQCIGTNPTICGSYFCRSTEKNVLSSKLNGAVKSLRKSVPQGNVTFLKEQSIETSVVRDAESLKAAMVHSTNVAVSCETIVPLQPKIDNLFPVEYAGDAFGSMCNHKATDCSEAKSLIGRNEPIIEAFGHKESLKKITPPGKNFYLNRLDSMQQCSSGQESIVSLPELLHPIDSISRMFIATFTSDIKWFLSYCGIPPHVPITIACHNNDRCWSADPGKRTSVPDPDFPNLIVVYPPFPEVIAFGKDRKNKGVGCHHPKLLVLQREDSIRVIITSANLVPKQWRSVTNTVWWQDFPSRIVPDYTSLFNNFDDDMKTNSTSDFAAQLAGFMASLITDIPSQAYWIFELTKYDFTEANAHLIASVPGIHSYRSISTASIAYESKQSGKFLGSVVASVVGLSHRFQGAADSNGIQLKKLAAYLGQSSEKGYGMSEIILRREKSVPQDVNAVSVLVSNPKQSCTGDYVQLGFLPRTVAKWISPLWDFGFFRFHGYVCPKEALAAASGESSTKVPLVLYVSQGPNSGELTKRMKPAHIVAFSSLIASLQRCTGLWRLEEILHRYKWPESLESDFIYGASSIGTSVGAQFLATFSAAAGKKSLQLYDSEESDPEWGRWNATHEMKSPSIRIIFPTIERVKSSHFGILPSRYTLSFSEKTWQKLKMVDILHDAIPHPSGRVGHPMHVKVARRRFKSKSGASFGWVYCGSHNISAAAWGRTVSNQSRSSSNGNSSGSRLHVCNYELGCIFVFPPSGSKDSPPNMDDISLPFATPAPKYGPRDRPATMRAMSEALAELVAQEGMIFADVAPTEEMVEEELEEEDEIGVGNYVGPEAEEETAYADVLWHHVDSSQSC